MRQPDGVFLKPEIANSTSGLTRTRALRSGDVLIYRVCEDVTEALIYSMVLFSPWAFGTTQPWAIWTMNVAGYLLGALLAAKLAIRRLKGYRPARWDDGGKSKIERRLTIALAALTGLILSYCLIGAVNARSTYHARELSFEYHPCFKWLPHSFDSGRTWFAFWSYLGLACSFWAVRDWLVGKSVGEQRAERQKPEVRSQKSDAGGTQPPIPTRLRRLLWVLAINGGLLGLEGIVQRLEGSGRLLFLVKPGVNPDALSQFGPYAYRGSAASYFNLLWPVCLGFWWTLQRSSKRNAHHLLLVCTTLMAASPMISTSRGGALITVGIVALAGVLMVWSHFFWKQPGRVRVRAQKAEMEDRRSKIGDRRSGQLSISHLPSPISHLPSPTLAWVALCFAAALGLGYAFGWKALKPRLAQLSENFEGREAMYDTARPMAADYPLFGVGPGTFESVFQLYRISTDTYWPAQLHNDWLETRITFGWIGSALIGLAFVVVILHWFARGGIHGGRRFMILIWIALAGCLVHARFDFPFQIFSIVFLFLVLCAILSTLSNR